MMPHNHTITGTRRSHVFDIDSDMPRALGTCEAEQRSEESDSPYAYTHVTRMLAHPQLPVSRLDLRKRVLLCAALCHG